MSRQPGRAPPVLKQTAANATFLGPVGSSNALAHWVTRDRPRPACVIRGSTACEGQRGCRPRCPKRTAPSLTRLPNARGGYPPRRATTATSAIASRRTTGPSRTRTCQTSIVRGHYPSRSHPRAPPTVATIILGRRAKTQLDALCSYTQRAADRSKGPGTGPSAPPNSTSRAAAFPRCSGLRLYRSRT